MSLEVGTVGILMPLEIPVGSPLRRLVTEIVPVRGRPSTGAKRPESVGVDGGGYAQISVRGTVHENCCCGDGWNACW